MKVQIIGNTQNIKCADCDITYSRLNEPKTLDSFDVNIVDLQDERLWRNQGESSTKINASNDLKSIQQNLEVSSQAINIIAIPQNYFYQHWYYAKEYHGGDYLKNKINNLKEILSDIIPKTEERVSYSRYYDISYENAITICDKSNFKSAFYFSNFFPDTVKTKAKDSNKATTILVLENCYLTTLLLSDGNCNLMDYLTFIGINEKGQAEIPEWINNFDFFDDAEQRKEINKNTAIIETAQAEIDKANKILDKNLYYKSVLYETGDNLVKVVTEMLGKLYNYDMTNFVDKKDEDFRITLEDKVFLGEIKGINTNVKKANVSQVLQHTSSFEDDNKNLLVKGLLIINHQRDKTLEERENINSDIIKFATKNDVLIIPTIDLLKIFEKFLNNDITSEKVIEQFASQSGLIDINKI